MAETEFAVAVASAARDSSAEYVPVDLPSPTASFEQCKADIARTGLCILDGALSPRQLERARTCLYNAAQEDVEYGGKGINGDVPEDYGSELPVKTHACNQRVWGLLNRGQPFIEMVEHPAALDMLGYMLGPNFLLSSISANITAPGHEGMMMHADQLFVPQPWPDQPQGVNVIWLMDDFTAENGGTLVAPGSHSANRPPVTGQDEKWLVPLVARAGSMVVMEGRIWHKTGANTTKDQRRAGVFSWFVSPIYRTQENWFLSLNPLILQRNPSDSLLRMLGYKVRKMVFGHVNGYEPLPTDNPPSRPRTG